MGSFCRQQLFRHLEHCASLVVAFHYAHTDAAHSMLHFDLLLPEVEEEQLQAGAPNRGLATVSLSVGGPNSAKARIIQEVRPHTAVVKVDVGMHTDRSCTQCMPEDTFTVRNDIRIHSVYRWVPICMHLS